MEQMPETAIPDFPEFRPLAISDRRFLERYAQAFPISDFAWPILWSWNVRSTAQISRINKEYIVQVIDALDGSMHYMLLGDYQAETLTQLASDNSPVHSLRWCPIPVQHPNWNCLPDAINADYVCRVQDTLALQGSATKKVRNKLQQFERLNLPFQLIHPDVNNPEMREQMLQLSIQKQDIGRSLTLENEAFRHFLQEANTFSDVRVLGIQLEDTLEAFSVLHRLNPDCFVILFLKSKLTIPGLSQRMMLESFRFIQSQQAQWANLESDLGLENLRRSKSLYPSQRVAKYTLERTS